MIKKNILLLSAILYISSSIAFYDGNPNITEFKATDNQFEVLVLNSADFWIIEFYSPKCKHCKKLYPEYVKAAAILTEQGIKVKMGAIDVPSNRPLSAPYDIKGFPSIKLFGADKSNPLPYNFPRTAEALVDFAMKQAVTQAKILKANTEKETQ